MGRPRVFWKIALTDFAVAASDLTWRETVHAGFVHLVSIVEGAQSRNGAHALRHERTECVLDLTSRAQGLFHFCSLLSVLAVEGS